MSYIKPCAWEWATDLGRFRKRHWELAAGLMWNFTGGYVRILLPWFAIELSINYPHWDWIAHNHFVRDLHFWVAWSMNDPIEDGGLIYKHGKHWSGLRRHYEPEYVHHA